MGRNLKLVHYSLAALTLAALTGCPASYGDDDDDIYGGLPADNSGYVGDPDEVSIPPEDVEDALCEDAPAGSETYFVSADDSNSQAQPAWIRAAIEAGTSWSGAIRPYEFLNYYDFDYGPGSELRIEPQLRVHDDGLSLLVAVVAPDKALTERRPLNLTFSLDRSGSMGGRGIDGMKHAMRAIAAELQEGDTVSVVSWSASQVVAMNSRAMSGPNDPALINLINGLDSGGSTNLQGGLQRAYEIAAANSSSSSLDRVILISDGGANVGVTSADLIAEHAEDGESDGIYLAAIGTGSIQEQFLDTITDLGQGSYLFVDSAAEAQRKLRGPEFLASLDLAARDVQLDITLPEGLVINVFSGEEISTNPDEVRPQHLAPNDAMLYHFDLVDCGEAADWADREISLHVEWLEPTVGTPMSADLTVSVEQLALGAADQVLKADAILAYTNELASENPDLAVVAAARAAAPNDQDLIEVERLLTLMGALP
ncbi:MAG: VWA domain-containing protein [Deltaproteobacteria bacterium]|nr:VWA domain-containing protein [Deltaproteobacteria bacterium]